MNTYDLNVYQGDTYTFSVEWNDSDGNPKDLSLYTPRMQIRDTRNRLQVDLSLNNGIEINDHDEIIVTLLPAQTASLSENTSYEYDLEMKKSDDEIETILRGNVIVTAGITKDDANG